MTLSPHERPGSNWLGKASEVGHPAIRKHEGLAGDELSDDVGDHYFPPIGAGRDSSRGVDGLAEEITTFLDGLSGVDTYPDA